MFVTDIHVHAIPAGSFFYHLFIWVFYPFCAIPVWVRLESYCHGYHPCVWQHASAEMLSMWQEMRMDCEKWALGTLYMCGLVLEIPLLPSYVSSAHFFFKLVKDA